jgi:hypothetical protein
MTPNTPPAIHEVTRRPTGHRRREPVGPPPAGARIIDGDALLVDTESGHVVAVQWVVAQRVATAIASLARTIPWHDPVEHLSSQGRLSGIAYPHRTFGYTPPVPLRRRFGCQRCTLDQQRPQLAHALTAAAEDAYEVFGRLAPDAYAATVATVTEQVAGPWRIGHTCWTSGILNKSAQLPYHRDAGNFPGTWSAMIAAKRWCEGGWLHLADLDLYLTIPHGSITVFDGQSIMHGVTPFTLGRPTGYRYTAVMYARQGMRTCSDDPDDEAARAALAATASTDRKAATLRERRR